MNNTPKNKTQRLEIRVTPENKKKIERNASKCGLTTTEYVTKRALGFTPRTVLPDAFFTFYGKLCEICNYDMTPETEAKLLTLIDEIHSEILSPKKTNYKKSSPKIEKNQKISVALDKQKLNAFQNERR